MLDLQTGLLPCNLNLLVTLLKSYKLKSYFELPVKQNWCQLLFNAHIAKNKRYGRLQGAAEEAAHLAAVSSLWTHANSNNKEAPKVVANQIKIYQPCTKNTITT